MHEILNKIGQYKLVPVIAIDDAERAKRLGDALAGGGLPVAEITFRTAAAEQALAKLAKRDDMLIGAGTVLQVDQAKRALAAGAQFIVSPGFSPPLVDYCLEQGVAVTPGCATPTDLHEAVQRDLSVVKFFPAEAMGGVKMLKALSAPFRALQFVPTGGITLDNLKDYLAFDCVLACGGSWMVKPTLINEARFEEIQQLTEAAVTQARQ